jgi:SAM-dependent methyltransferase
LSNPQALLDRPWPPCVDALLVQQIKEPAQERQIAATIPALTAIEGEVSRAVRAQYEENPYPRWVQAGPPGQPPILSERQAGQSLDVLIAGCGTGLSTTELARHARGARLLAIDLSLASLSYAKRMAQSFGLTNIEFAQADIMKLSSIGRDFDFIDASGVLHHLDDPWAGWRVLLSLLRPGGAMEVGLYSERGRRNVVAARAMIARRGYRPVPEDIRRFREDIAAAEDGSLLKSLARSDDFFSMSECRDLLFHPQEHRLSLPDIKVFLANNHLQFAGFVLPQAILRRFAIRFSDPAAMTDLDRWNTFESEAPDTFAGMYLFSLYKLA